MSLSTETLKLIPERDPLKLDTLSEIPERISFVEVRSISKSKFSTFNSISPWGSHLPEALFQ